MQNQDQVTANQSRRNFLIKMGFVALALETLPSHAEAQTRDRNDPEFPPEMENDHLVINSGLGYIPHRHNLLIPMKLLNNPPQGGIELRTTKTAFHTHAVKLTMAQIIKIKRGEEVVVKDATVGEHAFRIYLPQRSW